MAQWTQSEGPSGGYMDEIVSIESSLLVTALNGGIYKSINNGETWLHKNSGLPLNARAEDLVEHNGSLFASIGSNGLYLSTDEGENWTPINSGINDLTLSNIGVNESDIYAGNVNGGIFYSADKGGTWTEKSQGVSNIQFQDFVFFNSEIYVAGNSFFKSSNNGDTWVEVDVPGLGFDGVRSMTVTDTNLYIGTTNGNIFKSADGVNWTKLALNIGSTTVLSMGISKDIVYLTTSQGRLYYTNDEGLNWTLIQNNETISSANHVILLSDKMIMSTDEGLYTSTDDGLTWYDSSSGINALQIISLQMNNSNVFAGTSSSGIYRSDLLGNWTKINSGLNTLNSTSIHDILIIEGQLIIGTGGGVYTSSDNGDSWSRLFDPGINKSIQALNFDNENFVSAVNGSGVYLSVDNAQTWTLTGTTGLNTETSYHSIDIDGDNIVVSTHESETFISKDLGVTWTDITPIPSTTYDVQFANEKLYLGTSKGLFVSEDLGDNWTLFNNDSMPIKSFAINGDNLYSTSFDGVYITSQDADTWYNVSDGIENESLNEIKLYHDKIYVGTFKASVWERLIANINIPGLVIEPLSIDAKNVFIRNNFSIYPNPVKSELNIISTNSNHSFQVNILSMEGKLLYSKNIIEDNIKSLDISSIPSGIYILQIMSQNQTGTMKLVKE